MVNAGQDSNRDRESRSGGILPPHFSQPLNTKDVYFTRRQDAAATNRNSFRSRLES